MLSKVIMWLSHHKAESAIIALIITIITVISSVVGNYMSGLGAKQAEIKATQTAEKIATSLASMITPSPTNTFALTPTNTLTPEPTATPSPTHTATPIPSLTPTPTPVAPPTATVTPLSVITSVEHVDAWRNIYGAGKLSPPSPGGGGGGELPIKVPFTAHAGQTLIVSSVDGEVSGCPEKCGYNGADGGLLCTGNTYIVGHEGISGIVHSGKVMFLVGVFLDNIDPTAPSPESLEYNDEEDDKPEFSPLLNQVFFIGDGRTRDGIIQRFRVPPNATRLYLDNVTLASTGNLWQNSQHGLR